MKDRLRKAMNGIRSGRFAKEWANEQAEGYPNLTKLMKQAEDHPITKTERKVHAITKCPKNYSVDPS